MKTSISELPLQRPTWADVNLDSIRSNYLKLTQLANPASVMAVVKSDAYGHGAVHVARELEEAGASFFGVATAAEAIALKQAGIQAAVLVLSGMVPDQLPLLLHHEFIPAVYTSEFFETLVQFASKNNRQVQIHLKIDTGMARLGFDPEDAARLFEKDYPNVRIDGIFTHMACADSTDRNYTERQLRTFQDFLDQYGHRVRYIHAAGSAALLNYPQSKYNLVRPGLLLYGISPISTTSDFSPVLSLKSRIIFLNRVSSGQGVGYGLTFRAQRDSLIATVPFGYADGLRRGLSNRLKVEVCGTICPIVGTINMDLCMIDVTDVQDRVKPYDEITFLGPKTTAWDWANLLNTIPYEITSLIGSRVPRVYYKNGVIHDVYYP
ncbi:MAG: alanine racemase [Acidobacteria bacterium]|nr:MAG: alanine racemase [Acidobacteriota bacterium]